MDFFSSSRNIKGTIGANKIVLDICVAPKKFVNANETKTKRKYFTLVFLLKLFKVDVVKSRKKLLDSMLSNG